MNHLEVKQLHTNLSLLVNHLIEQKNNSFYVNYALDRNLTMLLSDIKTVDNCINPRLKELDIKAYELGGNNYEAGLKLLSEEEQAERNPLAEQFDKDLLEESDIVLFRIDPEKCQDLKIEYPYLQILSKLFK